MNDNIYRPDNAKTTNVIIIKLCKGKETESDPYRGVYQFWIKNGNLIAERDVNDFAMENF